MRPIVEITRKVDGLSAPRKTLIEGIHPDHVTDFVQKVGLDETVTRVRVLDEEPEAQVNVGELPDAAGPSLDYRVELKFLRDVDRGEMVDAMCARHGWTSIGLSDGATLLEGPGTPEALELLSTWTKLLTLRRLLLRDGN
jgi:hypothetical protein